MIAQAIRKSLSGQAKRVLLPLGTASTVNEMLEKLEGVFGNVATGMSVLEEIIRHHRNKAKQSMPGV